jgi:hypothetical protein
MSPITILIYNLIWQLFKADPKFRTLYSKGRFKKIDNTYNTKFCEYPNKELFDFKKKSFKPVEYSLFQLNFPLVFPVPCRLRILADGSIDIDRILAHTKGQALYHLAQLIECGLYGGYNIDKSKIKPHGLTNEAKAKLYKKLKAKVNKMGTFPGRSSDFSMIPFFQEFGTDVFEIFDSKTLKINKDGIIKKFNDTSLKKNFGDEKEYVLSQMDNLKPLQRKLRYVRETHDYSVLFPEPFTFKMDFNSIINYLYSSSDYEVCKELIKKNSWSLPFTEILISKSGNMKENRAKQFSDLYKDKIEEIIGKHFAKHIDAYLKMNGRYKKQDRLLRIRIRDGLNKHTGNKVFSLIDLTDSGELLPYQITSTDELLIKIIATDKKGNEVVYTLETGDIGCDSTTNCLSQTILLNKKESPYFKLNTLYQP